MIGLCTTLWLSALAGVTVTVAPDQPLPHVYIDEPLILELMADESMTVTGEVRVHNDDGFVQALPLGTRRLPGGAARWLALDDIAVERGNYRLEIVLRDDEDREWERQVDCCFIGRPPDAVFGRVLADASGSNCGLLELASRGAGIGAVRLNFASADFEQALVRMVNAGLRVVVSVRPADAAAMVEQIAGLERTQRDLVTRCELAYEGDPAEWVAAAAIIDQGLSGLDATAVVSGPDDLVALFEGTALGLFRHVVFTGDDPEPLREEAQRLGMERLSLFTGSGSAPPMEYDSIAAWLQQFLTDWAAGFAHVAVSEGHLLSDEGLGKAYPYLAMMAHRLQDYRFMGALPLESDSSEVLVFRRGAAWLVAAWGEPSETVELPLGDATITSTFDARGNPVAAGTIEDGVLTLPVNPMPHFWTGEGGDLFTLVARSQAIAGAREVMAHPRRSELLHPDIVEMITGFLASPDEPVSRRHFFTLLQSFPELEASWHGGREPMSDLVPLMARLAAFTRAVCVLEEGHGEQFLEPLSDTLAQCSEYQALYVTGSTGGGIAQDRGDWLLRDVERLTTEARLLSEHGLLIEANAVANLAEWRARSLGAIAQAVSEAR